MSRPSTISDPSRLAPPDSALSSIQPYNSPPRLARGYREPSRERALSPLGFGDGSLSVGNGARGAESNSSKRSVRRRERRKKGQKSPWKKLLWVRQGYPDNFTDVSTFLDHLQRNPRLQPYEFWRLVADSSVIVQHVCSVAIFVSCFSGIFQERVSPVTVVGWGSAGTVLGWVLWDFWVGKDEDLAKLRSSSHEGSEDGISSESLGKEYGGSTGTHTPLVASPMEGFSDDFHPPPPQVYGDPLSSVSPRNQQRIATVKSAVLIYCAVLGLSPILKSLTKSTTSDSIWAMSCWLMGINVFFFDYGGGVGAKFPASLSTNAALMASTVLASRLTSTTDVFSLTLFSIQVFGLFPVFRRHLLHVSRTLHYLLTLALLLGAAGGVAVTVTSGSWAAAIVGCFLGLLTAAVAMGGASWWLIGLQKWKDEIVGPWDVARPRLRRRWD